MTIWTVFGPECAGSCFLTRQSYYGNLLSIDVATRMGTFQTDVSTVPKFQDETFSYLSAYWQAYHIWMVADESLGWQELIFASSDAVSDRIEGSDGQTLTRLKKANPEDLSNPELNILRNGWDHEHCELCNTHIDPGDQCYYGDARYWVCRQYYPKYVRSHDLSFVDEI